MGWLVGARLMRVSPASYLGKTLALRAYFRGAEYPMGRVRAWWEAAKMARWWLSRKRERSTSRADDHREVQD